MRAVRRGRVKLIPLMSSSAKLHARHPVASRIALYGTLLVVVVLGVLLRPRVPAPVTDTAWSEVDYEANEDVRRLQALVRIDTTPDTGREIDAARYLAGILEDAGLTVEIEEHPGAKANLWAILEGESEEALVLHNHLDVDPIRRPEDWVVPPFEARLEPPWIIGRGVFDMKSVTVAQLAAVLAAKERMDETGRRPRRSLIFLATSSEETGSGPGTRHILANRPELTRRFWAVLTEGGVLEAPSVGEVKYWGTSFAQKQFLEVTATSGSAERLEELRTALFEALRSAPPTALVPEVKAFATAYAPSRLHPDYRAALAEPERVLSEPGLFERLPALLKALFRNEAHPFAVEPSPAGGYRLRIVLHVLPGLDADAAAAELLPDRLLDGIDIRIHERRGAVRGSPLDHPAYVQLIESLRWRTGVEPGRVGPYLLTRYANDSRFFRNEGIASYGFTPFRLVSADTMTVAGPNEKIALPAFVEGVELYAQVVRDLLDAAPPPADPAALVANLPAPDDPVGWLQRYVSYDTSNPPGGERLAAEYLAALIERGDPEGEIEVRMLVSPDGRANLYARLPANAVETTGRGLVLLHHLDVVPAGDGWSRPPFGGELHRGRLWGRGALDAKSLGVAHLVAMLDLLESDRSRRRDLVLVASADEEAGGEDGVAWLLAEHPELFGDVEAVLNEAGVNRMAGDRLLWWGIETAQKQVLWLRVSAAGRGGHGSGFNPASPTHRLLRALNRVLDLEHPWRVTAAAHQAYRALAEFRQGEFAQVFDQPLDVVQAELDRRIRDGTLDRILLPGMSASFQDTVQITRIDNGAGPVNVAPGEASALIDARLLPDTDVDRFRRRVETVLGSGIHVEELLRSGRSPASSTSSDVYRTLEGVLGVHAPVAPTMIAGTTDSRFFRRHGVDAYGFSPFTLAAEDAGGIHGADERIPVEAFLRGCETMKQVVAALVLAQDDSLPSAVRGRRRGEP